MLVNQLQEVIFQNFAFTFINILFTCTGILLTIFTALAAKNYIERKQGLYYLLTLIYMMSFSLLILTNNWFIFITAWELVTLTTALMLIWENKRIAGQYFIIQFVGSSLLLYVILLAISKGYLQIGFINETWLQNIFIFGLGVKSAIFGVHFWLAPVHSTAPSPVSAILSGWVVKMGFITLLKLIPEGNVLLVYLGFLMIFYGGIKALLSTDYKVLLAFSTISQLGFIALAIGSGTYYGFLGAIFHIIAHGMAKTTLFIGSGYWLKEYGTRTIYKFKRVFKRQKTNSAATLLALLSLAGFPLLAGYNSKYLIKHAFEHSRFLIMLLHMASILTVLYVIRFLKWGFGDKPDLHSKNIKGNYLLGLSEKLSLIPALILLIFPGIFPNLILNYFNSNIKFHLLSGSVYVTVYIIIGLILLYKLNWLKVKEKEPPSLDKYFKTGYELIYILSAKTKQFDADVFFEKYLYGKIYNGARILYTRIFVSFQCQLLWIPLLLILLFIWIMI